MDDGFNLTRKPDRVIGFIISPRSAISGAMQKVSELMEEEWGRGGFRSIVIWVGPGSGDNVWGNIAVFRDGGTG